MNQTVEEIHSGRESLAGRVEGSMATAQGGVSRSLTIRGPALCTNRVGGGKLVRQVA